MSIMLKYLFPEMAFIKKIVINETNLECSKEFLWINTTYWVLPAQQITRYHQHHLDDFHSWSWNFHVIFTIDCFHVILDAAIFPDQYTHRNIWHKTVRGTVYKRVYFHFKSLNTFASPLIFQLTIMWATCSFTSWLI